MIRLKPAAASCEVTPLHSGQPRTIQIFLPNGDPQGIRSAEITTAIIRVFDVPRTLVEVFAKMPEASQVGLYFLLGENEVSGLPQAYIGQSGAVGSRLAKHNQHKEFWGRALIVVSLTNSLTNTHAGFLEWLSIKQATESQRYLLENATAGGRPHMPGPLEADCMQIQELISILVATLGHPIFEPVAKTKSAAAQPSSQSMLYCKGAGADGRGAYTEEGFVVFKGSSGPAAMSPAYSIGPGHRVRERLTAEGVIKQEGDRIVFQRDHLFTSPSTPAHVLLGRGANGWMDWKNAAGATLDSLVRSPD